MHWYERRCVSDEMAAALYGPYCIKSMSLMLDMLIILRTIKVVIMFKGH